MLSSLKTKIINYYSWKTNRKIIVIQSDDWGSIRMPSNLVRNKLEKHPHINVDNAYDRFDTLARVNDITALFEVLRRYKDKNGNHPVVTTNCVLANPCFEAIKNSGYQQYFFEPIQQTFEKYKNAKALQLWGEGVNDKLFCPQFHGREHVNVSQWMSKLLSDHPGVRYAADKGVFSATFPSLNTTKRNFQTAWDYVSNEAELTVNEAIEEGLAMFRQFFGYQSISAIAPAYTWSDSAEKILVDHQVIGMQGIHKRKIPLHPSAQFLAKSYLYTGKKNTSGQYYLVRNSFFEKSHDEAWNGDNCLSRVKKAFDNNTPAIISSHRVNFIGSLNEANRTANLIDFSATLKAIVTTWPDVEFLSTPDLLRAILTPDD